MSDDQALNPWFVPGRSFAHTLCFLCGKQWFEGEEYDEDHDCEADW